MTADPDDFRPPRQILFAAVFLVFGLLGLPASCAGPRLEGNAAAPEGAQALAESTLLSGVWRLRFGANQIGDAGGKALLEMEWSTLVETVAFANLSAVTYSTLRSSTSTTGCR